MSPLLILGCIGTYFCFLLLIAWRTSRNATSASYYLGNKASPWYAVAFGLIGDSLSGVTFISVPGRVASAQFSYMQVVLGYVVGYVVIAQVLLPMYYRLNLTSIYSYLQQRFGRASQKSGAFFFLLSRTTGAAARLYLAANIIQAFVFDAWGIPFALTVSVIILLILAYTLKGGIRTLVWTDTFQSSFLILGVVLSIWAIARELDLDLSGIVAAVRDGGNSQVFFWDWQEKRYFWKQFLSGVSLAIVMTGLDQNMMQKNLSCRSLREAQWNIYAFTGVMLVVNALFLSLGALLYHYAGVTGVEVPADTDKLFPLLVFQHLGIFAGIVFVAGLTAATFSSADSVLTTLTTSFLIDFLEMDKQAAWNERRKTVLRHQIHILFAVLLLLVILAFKALNSQAVITAVLTLAGYTYGPLLGLFAFGLFTKAPVKDRWVPLICVAAPVLCWVLNSSSERWLSGYQFGFELLILNGLFTFFGLWLARERVPRTV
jgi:Na+/proline symporter